MNYVKLTILLILSLGLAIGGLNLATPSDAQARPLPGFTPQPPPPPPPPPDGQGSGGGDDNEGHRDSPPLNYAIVQLEHCNMTSCPVNSISVAADQTYAPLALADKGNASMSIFVPVEESIPPVEIQAQVRLVHEGSGWIAEGTISDTKSTRFALPYPGRWQVFLTQIPKFMTAEAIDTRFLNLEQLETKLKDGPISLGMVEANNSQIQWVKCPLACVLIEEPPSTLPVTGGQSNSYRLFFVSGALMWLLAVLIYRRRFCASPKN